LVDDVRDNREMYGEYLSFCGWLVDEAVTAEEALAKLDEATIPPDVVVMDLSLPKMDGLEATQLIKANPRFCATKVIVLSGFVGPRYARLALDAGADTFASKPCTPLDLLQCIVRVLPPSSRARAHEKPTTLTRRKRR
jgi:CheY-like chemotaxis protein